MSLLDQSGVTGGGFDPYNVHALFVNMDNMWTERFGNYDCLVFPTSFNCWKDIWIGLELFKRCTNINVCCTPSAVTELKVQRTFQIKTQNNLKTFERMTKRET